LPRIGIEEHTAEGHPHTFLIETSCESHPVLKTSPARRPILRAAAHLAALMFSGGRMRSSLGAVVSIGAASALVLHLSTQDARTQSASCFVLTSNGAVQGVDRGASCAFLGVPYAASSAGERRWRPPQPPNPWAPAILNASAAPNCPGFNAATGAPQGIEDCLKLIIWTPDPMPATPAPVLIWLHPGAFVAASANLAASNGQRFAEETGTIVVAANYRLGAFGFLAHAALSAEDPAYPSSGNYGLLDQRAAFAWVREQIAAFGGDPQRVTIAGSSAGALSVGLHLVSPGSTGLFDRAIIQSGPPTLRWRTRDEAEAQGARFAAALGCVDPSQVLACMRSRTRDQVLSALPIGPDQILEGQRVQWGPVVDGLELPDQPRMLFESGASARVPLLVGTNRDEGWVYVDRSFPAGVTSAEYEGALSTEFGADAAAVGAMYSPPESGTPDQTAARRKEALAAIIGDAEYVCEARRVARSAERAGVPVFVYSFEHEIDPVAPDRVIHGLEVNLLFGNNFGAPSNYVLSDSDRELARAMAGYWARFAAQATPNTDDETVAHWPAFKHPTGQGRGSDKHLVLGLPIGEGMRVREAACDFWEPYFLRSTTGAVPAATP
jgi:para-nitrobenzyl esterase